MATERMQFSVINTEKLHSTGDILYARGELEIGNDHASIRYKWVFDQGFEILIDKRRIFCRI